MTNFTIHKYHIAVGVVTQIELPLPRDRPDPTYLGTAHCDGYVFEEGK